MNATANALRDCIGMPAATFVMHREPLLLLDTLVECDGDNTVCELTVRDDDAFVDPGKGVPAHVGVEYMAQCVAVHAGARARVDGLGPPLGFLLGTRQFTSAIPYFAVGQSYRVTCKELIRDDNGMGAYECSVLHGDRVVASARLSVLEKERGKPLK